jgi:RNA polymerase sigma-70 factor (ECF subfamily)
MAAMSRAAQDTELIRRIAAGEEAALRALLAAHQTRVFRFVLRLVGNAAVAEEVMNEVFLEVWRHAARFEGASAPSTWILSIAHNRAVSRLRKRSEETWDEDAAGALQDERDDPEIAAQKVDKGEALRRCIDTLSAEHKAVIDLVYYHELSVSEVSEVLKIPENTVKTRMFYARKRLSELLKAHGVDRGWP